MGNNNSTQKLQLLEQKATSIYESFNLSNGQIRKEDCLELLKKVSQDAVKLKGAKRSAVDALLSLIDDYRRNIISTQQNERRVSTFTDSSSFVALPLNSRKSRVSKNLELISKRMLTTQQPTMKEIQNKIPSLKQEIQTAINNNNARSLRTLERTIKLLSTDLQMIQVTPMTQIQETHEDIQKQLTTAYAQVTKALKELSRIPEHDQKSSIRSATKKELETMEKNVDEQNILLETALKTDNSLLLKHVFGKIEEFSQQLAALDDHPKKKRLLDKIENMRIKTNDRLERYTIANRLSEHEKDFNTIKKKKHDEEAKKLMENLRRHIEDIPDKTEDTIKRKKRLLKEVNDYIVQLSNELDAEVKLRKSDTMQSMEDLLKTWNDNKEAMKNASSVDEAKHLFQTLNQFESAIREVKQSIESKFNIREARRSSVRSYTSSTLVKAKAKIYNIPVDDVKEPMNVAVQLQADKKVEVLNEIRNIQAKFNFLRDKISKEPSNEAYKIKLQSYYDRLEDFVNWPNENVSEKAKSLREEMYVQLSNFKRHSENRKSALLRISVEASLEKLMDIQSCVVSIEYELPKNMDNLPILREFKETLLFQKGKLEKVKVNPHYDMIRQSKETVLDKINCCLETIERRLSCETVKNEEAQAQGEALRTELTKLKEQIRRFTGGHKNVLYNTIEKKMNKLLVDANECFSDEESRKEVVSDIEKHLKILEQRSTKPQSFRQSLNSESLLKLDKKREKIEAQLLAINESLSGIKNEIRIETPDSLNARLNLLKMELEQLFLKVEDNHKQKVVELLEDIEGCINFVSKRQTTESAEYQNIDEMIAAKVQKPKKSPGEVTLNQIQKNVLKAKEQIEVFIGDYDEYQKLDDKLLNINVDLRQLKFSDDKLNTQKKELVKTLDDCTKILDRRWEQIEELCKIEEDIQKLREKKPDLSDEKMVEGLDQALTSMQIRLTKIDVDKVLRDRKHASFEFLKNYLQAIRTPETEV
ncbi:probable DNA double-strand break repair Rad50 ATPase [Aethina tumida]|uniref:probable DNA double-strand break repair Rad50 ATPase n=1 Tax=Aethina tumida TaxID=116153 RepID=UPI00214871C5|nr:probable DNA double-strand break repair Rad50 ATPase [Aethina tumida]